MSYDVKIGIEKDYMNIVVFGKRTLEDSTKLISLVVGMCLEKEIDKVIVDIRGLSEQPAIASEYKLAKTAVDQGKEKARRVAIVHRPEDFIYFSFFEKVANREGLCLCAFHDENEAIEWISKD